MEKSDRAKLHFKIVYRIGGGLFEDSSPIENLPLGPDFAVRIARQNMRRKELFDRVINELSKIDDMEIAKRFSVDGIPLLESSKTWANRLRREIDEKFVRLSVWLKIPLFRTRSLADFEHWARSEFLTVDEVVWLSVGLEPEENLMKLIKPYDDNGRTQKLEGVAEYMSRHKETIRRKFDPHDYGHKPDLATLYSWIKAVNLDVHSGFLNMLKSRFERGKQFGTVKLRDDDSEQIDGREKLSMSKLIAAMAIDCYGYDPRARRSDIPNEIQGIADRLGLDISSDTIRKYLKNGSELIPEDWKPE